MRYSLWLCGFVRDLARAGSALNDDDATGGGFFAGNISDNSIGRNPQRLKQIGGGDYIVACYKNA
jgi:hypothetical protein